MDKTKRFTSTLNNLSLSWILTTPFQLSSKKTILLSDLIEKKDKSFVCFLCEGKKTTDFHILFNQEIETENIPEENLDQFRTMNMIIISKILQSLKDRKKYKMYSTICNLILYFNYLKVNYQHIDIQNSIQKNEKNFEYLFNFIKKQEKQRQLFKNENDDKFNLICVYHNRKTTDDLNYDCSNELADFLSDSIENVDMTNQNIFISFPNK